MDSSSGMFENSVMEGKVCVVTGGTSGIGREIVQGLSRLGAETIIVGRSKEKCESTMDEIISTTSSKKVSYEVTDLSSMDSVRKLAERFVSQNIQIDVLINNAGGIFSKRILTRDGFESTIALNYLSPVLLTRLLLPSLNSSGHSRIINMGSGTHTGGRYEIDFRYPWRYAAMKVYSTAKLMFTMFSYSLARRLKGTGISSTLVQPGFVATNLGKNSGSSLLSAAFSIMRPFQISARKAAKTPVYLSHSPDHDTINGSCYSRMKRVQTSQISYDRKLQEELWLRTAKALEIPAEFELH